MSSTSPKGRSAELSRSSAAKLLSPPQDVETGSSAQPSTPGNLIYSNVGEARAHLVPAKACRGELLRCLPGESQACRGELLRCLPGESQACRGELLRCLPGESQACRGELLRCLPGESQACRGELLRCLPGESQACRGELLRCLPGESQACRGELLRCLPGESQACRGESPEKLPSEASGGPCPPPLPRKQLSRTWSLPEMQLHHYYPCKGAHFPMPQCIHNTLGEGSTQSSAGSRSYSVSTQTPLSSPKRRLSKSQSLGDSKPCSALGESHPSRVPRHIATGKLTFATPDGELVDFFKDLASTASVHETVLQLHLVSLIHLTAKMQELLGGKEEEWLLMGAALAGKKWADFTLLDKEPCCETGEAWYYQVRCAPEQTQHIFAAKVHKSYPCGLPRQTSLRAHFNTQQVFGHFIDSLPKDLMLVGRPQRLRQLHPGEHEEAVCTSATPPLAQVVISPEVPYQTLADFVKGSRNLHNCRPGHYERLACLLLLQLCAGLEHLQQQKIAHYDIHMENLLLVHCPSPPQGQQDNKPSTELSLPRLVISNFSKSLGKKTSASVAQDPDRISMAPKWLSVVHFQNAEGFEVGLLVYEILHQLSPLEKPSGLRSSDLPAIPALSIYSRGLQNLASLLLHPDPQKSLPIEQAKKVLQVLLWGPRQELFARNQITPVLLRNWLVIKRVLLLLKFAEKVSEQEATVQLEEWLCCLYFTETTEHTLLHTLRTLHTLESQGAC